MESSRFCVRHVKGCCAYWKMSYFWENREEDASKSAYHTRPAMSFLSTLGVEPTTPPPESPRLTRPLSSKEQLLGISAGKMQRVGGLQPMGWTAKGSQKSAYTSAVLTRQNPKVSVQRDVSELWKIFLDGGDPYWINMETGGCPLPQQETKINCSKF